MNHPPNLKTKIQSVGTEFTLNERRKTKRKVDLVSSRSDNERENGPLAAYSTEGSAVSELYKNDRIPSLMRYIPKDGERLIEEETYIPDVD